MDVGVSEWDVGVSEWGVGVPEWDWVFQNGVWVFQNGMWVFQDGVWVFRNGIGCSRMVFVGVPERKCHGGCCTSTLSLSRELEIEPRAIDPENALSFRASLHEPFFKEQG